MPVRLLRRSRMALAISGLAIAVGALIVLPAAAEDRCEGTLCDLYYGNSAPQPATTPQPAPARPLVAPNGTLLGSLFGGSPSRQQPQAQPADGSAPARKPLVAVQGGGLLGMMNGAPQERCEGTLCDLYYGGTKPERPEPTPQRAATGAAAAPDDAAEYAPQTAEPREIERPVERHCAGTGDPWSCYRR